LVSKVQAKLSGAGLVDAAAIAVGVGDDALTASGVFGLEQLAANPSNATNQN
jgi:hypothetical protein